MDQNILQYIGFVASGIIALSMTMNSFLRFRWINLFGASTFAVYGLLIQAWPVAALNGFIVGVDIYYLIKIYSRSDLFDTLEIRNDNRYLLKFLDFHHKEIQKFFPGFTYKPDINTVSFFVLRNTNVAGIFLAHRENDDTLKVGLDYVVPQYRDYRNGRFLYDGLKGRFVSDGFRKIKATGNTKSHAQYLKRVGFIQESEDIFIKDLKASK
jgi:hypothetical protein